MVIRFKVTLTPEERSQIEAITKKGKHESRVVLSARALLLYDASQEETLTLKSRGCYSYNFLHKTKIID
jgi:hypothetical protein